MKLLFLDIDGVLNDHTAYANGYCSIHVDKVGHLNLILNMVPDLQIVLSSAWRYTIVTTKAVETLLACHGCWCVGRIHGLTEPDEETHDGPMPDFGDREQWAELGIKLRGQQIRKYVNQHNPDRWVAVDDLPLGIEELVQTDPSIGMTRGVADVVIDYLTN